MNTIKNSGDFEDPMEFELRREGDRILFRANPADEFVPARVVRLRPLDSDQEQISIMRQEKKQELAYLHSLFEAPVQARPIIIDELQRRYFIPEIKRIIKLVVRLGNYYLDVDTNAGERHIIMHNPAKNVLWLQPDRCVLRDSQKNWFAIQNTAALDSQSQAWIKQAF